MAYYTFGQNFSFPSCSYASSSNVRLQNETLNAVDFLTQEQMTIGVTPAAQQDTVDHSVFEGIPLELGTFVRI